MDRTSVASDAPRRLAGAAWDDIVARIRCCGRAGEPLELVVRKPNRGLDAVKPAQTPAAAVPIASVDTAAVETSAVPVEGAVAR